MLYKRYYVAKFLGYNQWHSQPKMSVGGGGGGPAAKYTSAYTGGG